MGLQNDDSSRTLAAVGNAPRIRRRDDGVACRLLRWVGRSEFGNPAWIGKRGYPGSPAVVTRSLTVAVSFPVAVPISFSVALADTAPAAPAAC